MNHDLAHCTGEGVVFAPAPYTKTKPPQDLVCEKKWSCKRYLAYRELTGAEKYDISFISAVECIKNDHKLFKEHKQ